MNHSARMPAIFLGHGSPMNTIEDNRYTLAWEDLGKSLPVPTAILAISAHWMTPGEVAVTAMERPETIHDFGGFPQALFDIRYPAPGAPALAQRIAHLLSPLPVRQDQSWGLDHGTWSVLARMYPEAQIPVVQLSLDLAQPAAWHFELGRSLSALRDEGVLLMASGNVVHNLRQLRSHAPAWDWADRFNQNIRAAILKRDNEAVVDYLRFGQDAILSVPTNEHYLPLLYILGSQAADEQAQIIIDGIDLAAISMLSVLVA